MKRKIPDDILIDFLIDFATTCSDRGLALAAEKMLFTRTGRRAPKKRKPTAGGSRKKGER